MSLVFHYASPTTPAGPGFDVDLGNTVVRLGTIQGMIASAETGVVPICNIVLDDPGGTLDIVGLKRFYLVETAAASGPNGPLVWTGYIGRRTVKRGDTSARPSLRVGADRQWDVELADINAICNFRVISGADGKRPVETDIERITWLIGTVYLPLHDNGLIDTSGPVNMDKADLRGRMADDVLRECAQASGKNYWAYYDRTASQDSLVYLAPDGTFGSYDSTARLTNYLPDVDQSTTFYVLDDSQEVDDPTRVYAGVYLPYSGGAVYKYSYTTSYAFGFRDGIWPAAHVTTLSGANALATHALAISNTEDVRLTMTAKMPAAHVNDILEGQRVQVYVTHLPSVADPGYTWCRVLRRTVAQDETTDQSYNATFDLTVSPFVGTSPAILSFIHGGTIPLMADGTGNWVQATEFINDATPGKYVQNALTVGTHSGSAPPGYGVPIGTVEDPLGLWVPADEACVCQVSGSYTLHYELTWYNQVGVGTALWKAVRISDGAVLATVSGDYITGQTPKVGTTAPFTWDAGDAIKFYAATSYGNECWFAANSFYDSFVVITCVGP